MQETSLGCICPNPDLAIAGGEQSGVITPPKAPFSANLPVSAAEVLRKANLLYPLGLSQMGRGSVIHGWLDPIPDSNPMDRGLVGADYLGWVSYEAGLRQERLRARAPEIEEHRWPLAGWGRLKPMPGPTPTVEKRQGFELGEFSSNLGKERYCRAVAGAIEYIRAGDIYQVNLAHHLRASLRGSARSLAAHLFEIAAPKFGSYLESIDSSGMQRVIISLSPELFFSVDGSTRMIKTTPMKGTRAIGNANELHSSSKDRAELAMIVDLMRNDLGRVCELGSVKVEQEREIELHGTGGDGVAQTTATISGKLRANTGLPEILQTLMPGGSITGTPKIRAMQIIHEFEPCARGPYCGAIGSVDAHGCATFSIGIRSLCITGRGPSPGVFDSAVVDYAVGAGIVADSDPEQEWRETLDKAWMLHKVSTIQDVP